MIKDDVHSFLIKQNLPTEGGWDEAFDDEHRRFVGELERDCRVRAEFVDVARSMLQREPCSAYVVERSVSPLLERGLLKPVPKAPVMLRSAHAIYPANPAHPDVQAIALDGLRTIAKSRSTD